MTYKIFIVDNQAEQIEKLTTLFEDEAEVDSIVCSDSSDEGLSAIADVLINDIKDLDDDFEIKILVDLCLNESERCSTSSSEANRLSGVILLKQFENRRRTECLKNNITTFIISVHTRPGGEGAKDIRKAVVGDSSDTTFLAVLDKPIDPTDVNNPILKTGEYMCNAYVDYLDDDKATSIKTKAFHNVVLYGRKK